MRFLRSALAAIIVLVVGGIGVSPAWAACTYSVAPQPAGSNVFTANGGSAAISLTVSPASCAWTVGPSNPDWCFYNVSPTSGSGSGSYTIHYSVGGNEGTFAVPCSITVGTATFNATVGGCTYTLDATGVVAAAGATSGTIGVQTNGWGCQWTPAVGAGASWITLTPDLNCCQGSGTVGYSLAANPGAARTGTITIAPPFGDVYTYTVTQAAPTAAPSDGLWSIDAEAGASGRGFQIEVRGGVLVFTYYGYAVGGGGLWALSSGPMSGNTFTGPMQTYHGGMPLGGIYTPAVAGPSLGNLSITFATATTGTITFPGESPKAVSKFPFSGTAAPSIVPENGLWIVTAEDTGASGRGFQIEQRNGVLVLTYYGYRNDGGGMWTLTSGSMGGSTFSGTMDTYTGGTVLGGAYKAAADTGNAGSVTINFTSPTAGTITFPGEPAKAIKKFVW